MLAEARAMYRIPGAFPDDSGEEEEEKLDHHHDEEDRSNAEFGNMESDTSPSAEKRRVKHTRNQAARAEFSHSSNTTVPITLRPPAFQHNDNRPSEDQTPQYHPQTFADISTVATLLSSLLLPELVPQILEEAEYWTKQRVEKNTQMSVVERTAPKVYLCTEPILPSFQDMDGTHDGGQGTEAQESSSSRRAKSGIKPGPKKHGPVKKIMFELRSHDQGYSDEGREFYGTYERSSTWFTAGVLARPPHPTTNPNPALIPNPNLNPNPDTSPPQTTPPAPPLPTPTNRKHLQTNIHASRADITHTITWRADADDKEERGWVQSLKGEGESIVVEGWARWPGWVNHVGGGWVEVYLGGW